MPRMRLLALAACLVLGLTGCGAAPTCTTVPYLAISPAQSVLNSAATVPANQQIFTATVGEKPAGDAAGCAVPAILARAYPAWTNPDPVHIAISSAADASNGTATCKGPTGGPVTLTAVAGSGAQSLKAAVELTCK